MSTMILLSFLPITDKICFECVSKQWKELIYNKQHKLIINYENFGNYDTIIIDSDFLNNKNLFERIFKKLKFIKELEIYELNLNIFEAVIDNCHNLTSLKFKNEELISDDQIYLILSKFGGEFGQRLTSIDTGLAFRTHQQIKTLLRLTPNLETYHSEIGWKVINELFFPNLKEFKDIWFNDLNCFKSFADKYYKQIVSLKFCPNFEVDSALIQLCRFEHLEELHLSLYLYYCEYSCVCKLEKEMKLIADNCKNLKKLTLNFEESDKCFADDLFDVFSNFHSLKKLCIEQYQYDIGHIKSLKNCRNLKYFEILELNSYKLSHENFDGIEEYLPHLKYLKLQFYNNFIDDETLKNLAKLSNLRELILYSSKITKSGFEEFIKSCPKIRKIGVIANYSYRFQNWEYLRTEENRRRLNPVRK